MSIAARTSVLRQLFLDGPVPQHRAASAMGLLDARNLGLVALCEDYAHLTAAGIAACVAMRLPAEKERAASAAAQDARAAKWQIGRGSGNEIALGAFRQRRIGE